MAKTNKVKNIAQRRQALLDARQRALVFISYSRTDRDAAIDLATYLEAQGVPVWWDHEVCPGDDFNNAIINALDEARAVIVIWSDVSTKSPYVRDEARRAARKDKLITVHVPGFSPENLPLGFGDHHSESIEDRERLLRALARYGLGLPEMPAA